MTVHKHRGKVPTYKRGVMFLIFRDGQVLLEERNDPNQSFYGYTVIPAGKFDSKKGDKSFKDTAIRESGEEHGIVPKNLIDLGAFREVSTSGNLYVINAFLITDYDGEVINKEPERVAHKWVDIKIAHELTKFVNSKYVLLVAQKKLIEEGLIKG